MSTSNVQLSDLTPEQLAYLDTPQELGAPPEFRSAYARYLFDHGIEPKVAIAIDDCGKYFVSYKDDAGHVWPQSRSSCNKGSCLACAKRRASIEYDKYSVLSAKLGSSFTTLIIGHSASIKARKMLSGLKLPGPVPALSKSGFIRGRMVEKILIVLPIAALPSSFVQKIKGLDPEAKFGCYAKKDFPETLRALLNPDLPTEFSDRMRIELLPRRLHFQGVGQSDRKKLFPQEESASNGDKFEEDPSHSNSEEAPRCPKCRKLAIWKTQRITILTPASMYQWVSLAPPG